MSEESKPTAIKHDGDKTQWHLFPFESAEEIVKVLEFGAKKYDAHNWRKGFDYSRVTSAACRHLFAIMRGEKHDHESGLLHAAHLGCCVLFLIFFQKFELGNDDIYSHPKVLAYYKAALC